MKSALSVWWDGAIAGELHLDEHGDMHFIYDVTWLGAHLFLVTTVRSEAKNLGALEFLRDQDVAIPAAESCHHRLGLGTISYFVHLRGRLSKTHPSTMSE